VDVDRHLTPSEEEQPALRDDLLGRGLRPRLHVGVVVREKNHADAEVGFVEELVPALLDGGLEDLVGDLRGNARAVAGFRVRIHGAAMRQVAE
jgi:hypothetical protein